MTQRTLVISDLHLGNGGDFDTFAGAEALPALLGQLGATPLQVILNGDTVDFLMNEDPLELDPARALTQAQALFSAPPTAAVLQALGQVAARGGEVVVRLGNHDIELALPEVQELFRQSLGQAPEVAARVRFARGDQPMILTVGGARILISHGEQNDPWNKVDYQNLPGPDGPAEAQPERFTYSPGSRLVKTLMNPLKKRYAMRFADLLKPDFQGATLTALAVNPLAVKTIFQGSTVRLLWQLFRQSDGIESFASDGSDADLGLAHAMERAGLTAAEQARLQALLGDQESLAFADEDDSVLEHARVKLVQAGLGYYAHLQKTLTGDQGERYFALSPAADELLEAQRLATKFRVGAVVLGHTHAARFHRDEALTFVNTGTWIWLMRLPDASAGEAEWVEFLDSCRRNPRLDPQKGSSVPLIARFTGALIAPAGPDPMSGGATLRLMQWGANGVEVLGESRIAAAVESVA